MKIPRVGGSLLDIFHDLTWKPYLTYLAKSGAQIVAFGKCRFICTTDLSRLVSESMERLEQLSPEDVEVLSNGYRMTFIIEGDFPDNARVASFRFLIHRNAIDYGIDGVLSVVGFGLAMEAQRRKRGTFMFRLFPPNEDEIKSLWIDWLKQRKINSDLIQFYEASPLQKL